MGKKHFCFFQTAETGNRTPDSGMKGSGANHYPRAPALRVSTSGMVVTTLYQSCIRVVVPSLWDATLGRGLGYCMDEKQCCTNVRPALGTLAIIDSVQTTMPALTTIIQPLSVSPTYIRSYWCHDKALRKINVE